MPRNPKSTEEFAHRAYSFQVCNSNVDITRLIEEYNTLYNQCSDFICKNLQTPIKEFFQNVPEIYQKDKKWHKQIIQSSDKPLYTLFSDKNLKTHTCDDFLYIVLYRVFFESSTQNYYWRDEVKINNTAFLRHGVVKSVLSNYKTKFSSAVIKTKFKKIEEKSSADEKILQCIHFKNQKRLETFNYEDFEKSFDETIQYHQDKDDSKMVTRYTILKDFAKPNMDKIAEKYSELVSGKLTEFEGCKKKDIKHSGISIELDPKTPYELSYENKKFVLKVNKNFEIILYSNKRLVKNWELINQTPEKSIETKTNHTTDIKFNYKDNGRIYVSLVQKTPFEKEPISCFKEVGVDSNEKHMMFATSLKYNPKKHTKFVNIYKEMVSDPDFVQECKNSNKELVRIYKDLAKTVNFCPLEMDLLYSRNAEKLGFEEYKYQALEKKFSALLDRLVQKFISENRDEERQYIQNIRKIRSQLCSSQILKKAYREKQSEYDSGRTLEEIENNPFSRSEHGIEIQTKLNNISKTIEGCKVQIIAYAIRILKEDGYNLFCLENLTNANFTKTPPIKSLGSLNGEYFDVIGLTVEKLRTSDNKQHQKVWKWFEDKMVQFEFDSDEKITRVCYTPKGEFAWFKNDMLNSTIKFINFASSKDIFVKMSNNNNTEVVLVPAPFTSQMDSTDNKLYIDENGKRIPKERVRNHQEDHINGMNADYNAACNIRNIFQNETLRNLVLKREEKTKFNQPAYKPKKGMDNPDKLYNKLKKSGFTKVLTD